jgi:GlpG protein
MRQVGQLDNEKSARRFVAWLTTQQIDATAEATGGAWSIWVRDEDNLASARASLAEFSANPTSERFADAEKKAEAIRREAEAKREKARKNQVRMSDKWSAAGAASARRGPLTMILIGICIVVWLMSRLGQDPRSPVIRGLSFSDGITALEAIRDGRVPLSPTVADEETIQASIVRQMTWFSIRRGEVWRIFTPMLIHFGTTHLLFNMIMLYSFGGQIESRYGTLRLLLLVLALAALSNVGQALTSGPGFGGMSGVIYGLFGFAWMRSTYDPQSGLRLDQVTVFILLLWFVLCIATEIPAFQQILRPLFGGRVANVAHAVGLVAGMAVGVPWSRFLGKIR